MALSNINPTINKSLIIKAQNGDIKARNKLIEIALPKIENSIRDRKHFEDIRQEAVCHVINNLHKFDVNRGVFEHWVSVVARNVFIKSFQKIQRRFESEQSFSSFFFDDTEKIFERRYMGTPCGAEEQETPSVEDLLEIINNRLPLSQKNAFTLFYMEGMTHKEISKYLQIHEGTSKSNLNRAKERIIKELNK